jgi:translation initiation factor IF-2
MRGRATDRLGPPVRVSSPQLGRAGGGGGGGRPPGGGGGGRGPPPRGGRPATGKNGPSGVFLFLSFFFSVWFSFYYFNFQI